jgi:hypothetical protein
MGYWIKSDADLERIGVEDEDDEVSQTLTPALNLTLNPSFLEALINASLMTSK